MNSKYSKALKNKIVKYVRQGNTLKDSFLICGLNPSTYQRWTQEEVDGEVNRLFKEELVREALQAETKLKAKIIKKLLANKDYKAKVFFLERRYPQEYSIKQLTEVKGDVEFKFKITAGTPRLEPSIEGEIE